MEDLGLGFRLGAALKVRTGAGSGSSMIVCTAATASGIAFARSAESVDDAVGSVSW